MKTTKRLVSLEVCEVAGVDRNAIILHWEGKGDANYDLLDCVPTNLIPEKLRKVGSRFKAKVSSDRVTHEITHLEIVETLAVPNRKHRRGNHNIGFLEIVKQ